MKHKCEGVRYDSEDIHQTGLNYVAIIWNGKKYMKHFKEDFVPRLEKT
jgi:hypothetical protein